MQHFLIQVLFHSVTQSFMLLVRQLDCSVAYNQELWQDNTLPDGLMEQVEQHYMTTQPLHNDQLIHHLRLATTLILVIYH